MTTQSKPTDSPAHWKQRVDASPVFTWSKALGRTVRAGPPEDQAVSNVVKAFEALADANSVDAAAYGRVFRTEAELVRGILKGAIEDARRELRTRGLTEEELNHAEQSVTRLLKLPSGEPFDELQLWSAFERSIRTFDDSCRLGALSEAAGGVPTFKEAWRRLHDRTVDLLSGLLNELLSRFGEESIHDAWLRINRPIFKERYSQYDISASSWSDALEGLTYITFESSRAHLVGPARNGDCSFVDEGHRLAWHWDPCGTCGRAIRGDDIEGTPPRMMQPYSWPVLAGKYDWSWGKTGISPYGVQACIKLEQMGIDNFGYPIRVVDCPTYPDGRRSECVRYVYKDPTSVEAQYYERVGRTRPSVFGSLGSVDTKS